MAFPQVGSTNSSNETVDTTTHTVNLPASIASGDLVIIFITKDGADDAIDSFPGYTNFGKSPGNTSSYGYGYYRIADGNATYEGSTVQFTTTGFSERSAHVSLRITAASWHGTTPPEYDGTANFTSGDQSDPPSLTASWGAEDNLWFAINHINETQTTASLPTNYGNELTAYQSGTGEVSTTCCRRELNTATENPGAYPTNSSTQSISCATAVIRPAGSTAFTVSENEAVGVADAENITLVDNISIDYLDSLKTGVKVI